MIILREKDWIFANSNPKLFAVWAYILSEICLKNIQNKAQNIPEINRHSIAIISISKKLSLSHTQVRRYIKELQGMGLIRFKTPKAIGRRLDGDGKAMYHSFITPGVTEFEAVDFKSWRSYGDQEAMVRRTLNDKNLDTVRVTKDCAEKIVKTEYSTPSLPPSHSPYLNPEVIKSYSLMSTFENKHFRQGSMQDTDFLNLPKTESSNSVPGEETTRKIEDPKNAGQVIDKKDKVKKADIRPEDPEKAYQWELNKWTLGLSYVLNVVYLECGQDPAAYPSMDKKYFAILKNKIKLWGGDNLRLGAKKLVASILKMGEKYQNTVSDYWYPVPKEFLVNDKLVKLLNEAESSREFGEFEIDEKPEVFHEEAYASLLAAKRNVHQFRRPRKKKEHLSAEDLTPAQLASMEDFEKRGARLRMHLARKMGELGGEIDSSMHPPLQFRKIDPASV